MHATASDPSPAAVLWLVCAVCALLTAVLATLGGRWLAAARRVHRVQVPARALSSAYVGPGTFVDVEYPGPDGRPLRAQLFVWLVRAPGVPYTFDGTVWVDPHHPADVTPRRQGRTTRATLTLILAAVTLAGTVGTGFAALVVRFGETFPA
ncbi:hypothetical protein [Cellulomonas uda]|uniref:DUF3592 domain-containing protein n=1 Tax=Cellulomonas uda TaxID=1714 RepID=A0A4Y3KHB9_CELUD|nr:hypothetical protein [Cellulomonas uda]NII65042.1 hypothetical protein [Cellulomonas uda]GEA82340.1 hypothetical protein CUD01_27840 [Cellulomonas uda]